MFSLEGRRVWVAGHTGMVGSAVVRRLASTRVSELITATSAEVDLRDQSATRDFVLSGKPDVAIIAAARVGGAETHACLFFDHDAFGVTEGAAFLGECVTARRQRAHRIA